MKLITTPLVTAALFWILLFLLVRSDRPIADLMVRTVIWTAILGMSLVVVIKMVRGRRFSSSDQSAGLPARIRRWIMGDN